MSTMTATARTSGTTQLTGAEPWVAGGQVVRPGHGAHGGQLRLTRRGRTSLVAVCLLVMMSLGFVFGSGSSADDGPEPSRVIVVAPGQTLWDIAEEMGGSDVRANVVALCEVNGLDSAAVNAGQRLRVPDVEGS